MTALFQPKILVLVAATVILAGLGLVSWRFRPKPGARALAAVMGAATVWAVGSIYSLLSVSLTGNLLATYVAYLGISLVPVAWVFLALEYAGRNDWVNTRTLAVLLVVPLSTQVVAWTNASHRLLWEFDGLVTVSSFQVLDLSVYGPWFWVHTAHAYLLLAVGTVVFYRTIVRSRKLYRRQVAMMIAAIAIPWTGNVLHLMDVFPFITDPTPFLFVFSGAFFLAAFFRFRLLDIVPIARTTVVEEMGDGVIVLDVDDHVVDINPAAERLLSLDADDVVGHPAGDVFRSRYVERYRDVYRGSEKITTDVDGRERVLNLRISPLCRRTDELRGRVVIIRDVTVEEAQREQLKRQNEQLQRQNDRLEQFASIVSHDLQNPLSVAKGYLEFVRDECESEYLDEVSSAHDEMEALIDDLLTLAREGRMVGDTETVPLATVVNAAVSIEQSDATVELDVEEYVVEADPARVQQLFENLFSNALDHVGSDVTVRVGLLADGSGFFVEDDGPGIPESDRERVFESGFTGSASGTGIGLAIVRSIANAHGWNVAVTDGELGGARFEFRTTPDKPGRRDERRENATSE